METHDGFLRLEKWQYPDWVHYDPETYRKKCDEQAEGWGRVAVQSERFAMELGVSTWKSNDYIRAIAQRTAWKGGEEAVRRKLEEVANEI